jgi:hypothetical protein
MDPLLPCAAIAAMWPYVPEAGTLPAEDEACLYVAAEAAGRLDLTWPDPGIAAQARMERARLELGAVTGAGAGFRVAVDGRRSAPESGYIGLEGESFYGRILIAEGSWSLTQVGLTLAGGLVDDPWVLSGNRAFGFRPFAPSVAAYAGLAPRSDLGGTLTWVSKNQTVDALVSLQSGEGLARRERNDGKDLHARVTVRPIPDDAQALAIAIYGRQGSTGTASARNHRFGARVSSRWNGLVAGTELLAAWGVDGDTERTPKVWSTWTGWDQGWGLGFVRLDLADLDADTQEDGQTDVWAVAGVRPPGDAPQAPAYLAFGVHHTAYGPQAAPVAGGAGSAGVTQVFVQVGANLRLATPVQLAEVF